MRLAFALFKYFPYGGLQRDFARIACELQRRGHQCRVYCLSWQGEELPGVELRRVPVSALTNIGRSERFLAGLRADLASDPVDALIGFNRMPGLDIYFAADPCFLAKVERGRPWWYRLTPRYRHFSRWERAVFDPAGQTEILLISASEQRQFERYYRTPAARMHLLPPGVSPACRAPPDAAARRVQIRERMGLHESEHILLMVGSGFITKGVDRAISALARIRRHHPRREIRLLVAGQDRSGRLRWLAAREKVADRVSFLGGRDDVPELLLAADVLVHPARSEAAGIVLLEALVAGLPVVVTEVCGYAGHIRAAQAGIVLAEPFRPEALDSALERSLNGSFRARCRQNALVYASREDLYSLHTTAADLIEEFGRRQAGSRSVGADGVQGGARGDAGG